MKDGGHVTRALVVDEGLVSVTTRRVAKRAGVSAMTVVNAFGGIDGLHRELIDQVLVSVSEAICRAGFFSRLHFGL